MRIHILGICGTFMGGLAALARELGCTVSGSDQGVYPPMSTQLQQLGVALQAGYAADHLEPAPDLTLIGNALSRGNPAVEAVLDRGLRFQSGPQWLHDAVLANRRVLAVAGTHGKTTTTSLLAWILECAGRAPGFLVGGVPNNFGISARLGPGKDFVIEADEYDTAFFDKRSKFVHYRPQVAILNNLEFDHADIFDDVAAIQRQFHHLVRIVPASGTLIVNGEDARLQEVLAMGCWSGVQRFAIDRDDVQWRAELQETDGTRFRVHHQGQPAEAVHWSLLGRHNVMNALAAIAAAHAVGVPVRDAARALTSFSNVQRRLQRLGECRGITVYDDFAHHPTAIAATLAGLRARLGTARLVVALEPRSNSMRAGAHLAELGPSLRAADHVALLRRPAWSWDAHAVTQHLRPGAFVASDVPGLLQHLVENLKPLDQVIFMSNGGFEDAPRRLLALLGEPGPLHSTGD